MQLYQPTKNLFAQLQAVLDELTITDYTAPSPALSGATIGQHTRHIIELFLELKKGYANGTVNYENRKRDYRLETDKSFAIEGLNNLLLAFSNPDKVIELATDLSLNGYDLFTIHTTYYRELIYNIEHTVHHMALIRVAVQELTDIELPQSFGIASSTIKYREKYVPNKVGLQASFSST